MNFILKIFSIVLIYFFGFNQSFAQSNTAEKIEKFQEECSEKNYRSCYDLAEIYEGGGKTAPALKIYKELCQFGSTPNYAKACDKLEGGSQEVFLLEGIDAAKKNLALSYAEECRLKAYSGCWNLATIYIALEKTELANNLVKRACKGEVESACEYLKGDQTSFILFYSSLILFGICAFILAMSVLSGEQEFKATETVEESTDKKIDYKKFGTILQYSRPFFKRYFAPIVHTSWDRRKLRDNYKRKLASSGLTDVMTPEDFYAFKLFLIFGFPLLFLAIRAFLDETWPLKLIPVLAFVGYMYPDIWANGRTSNRRKNVIMAMPFSVDMLALSVEAGLDFVAAITKVVEKAKPSALTEEFEIMLKEIKIGASRAESLRNLAWRIDLIQISSFCATLIAADSVGANIGPILKSLAGEIRQKKSSEVEKAGATAATKILFPMLFLIVPAVFIVVAAPIALEMMAGGK